MDGLSDVGVDAPPLLHRPDDGGMGLPGEHQVIQRKAQFLSQNAVVFRYIFFGFIQLDGKIHACQLPGADTSQPGGEAMGHGDSLCS